MASRVRLNTFRAFVFVVVLLSSYLHVSPVEAKPSDHIVQDFHKFVTSVVNGNAAELRGVYVPSIMALPVVQQPTGFAGYVSGNDNEVTQFGIAAEVGNVGLLAHNHLAGRFFTQLKAGDIVFLVYGDGRIESFAVTQIMQYQALDPNSPYSEFKALDTQITSTAEKLFNSVYRGDRRVVFQTCIESNGDSSWGRLFVIAKPVEVDINDFNGTDVKDTSSVNPWMAR